MNVELAHDQVTMIVVAELSEQLETMHNQQFKMGDGRDFISKKDIKAIKRVINYYTGE